MRRAAATAYEAAHGALEEHDDDDAAPRWRFRVSPRVAATATIVVALVGAIIVYMPHNTARARVEAPAGALTSPQATPSSAAMVGFTSGSVVVHVAGAVASPGLYTLSAGDRIADAVTAAGGAVDGGDLDGLNLARVVIDGEQVRVPMLGESPVEDGHININLADASALEGLPGVGPVLAARIVEYREANGPFSSVDALDAVSGVGPAVLEKIRAAATV